MKSMTCAAAGLALLLGGMAGVAAADQGAQDPFGAFQSRFGGNQSFACKAPGGKTLNLNVGMPQADNDQMKAVPRAQWDHVLSIYLSHGTGGKIEASWGAPSFDASGASMSIRLQSGKTLVFQRTRAIPDPDADAQHFDRKPYFDLSIDGGPKLPCSQVFNAS
ncbi:hypothetical protein [Burkholderia sp. Ac-20379]|uniref:hypothetical protein n=1 Tax=Burkholderia sp. Ac-20379 TaxID=2703900 RepID=UPI00198043DF|nr:hypothetical protein [Burkholderia sp. Ac-20379]MBN3728579.1 hypothetical protein [Burkholderia sp. Ac-20379]